jgi:serine/threonine-protein kinase
MRRSPRACETGVRRQDASAVRAVLAAALATTLAVPAWHDADAQTQRRVRAVHGAIAYHRESESYGYAYDFPTERAAALAALQHCGRPDCEIAISFRNACAALADGPVTQPAAARGVTAAEAERNALRDCGERCRVIAWACTR